MGSSLATSPGKRVAATVLLAVAVGAAGYFAISDYLNQPLTDQDETIGAAPAQPRRLKANEQLAGVTAREPAVTSASGPVVDAPDLEATPPAAEAPAAPDLRASFGHRAGLHKVKDELNLSASAALVIDQDTGEVLLRKNGDAVLPIASLTKLMTALVVTEAKLPMDEIITITDDDVDGERHSRSRLRVGTPLTRSEAMQLALMSSENRAAHALGRTFPGGRAAFVQSMNRKAAALGMKNSRFVDPTGLSTGNQSTARDLSALAAGAAKNPVLADFSVTPQHQFSMASGRVLQYKNSNRLVKNPNWDILLQKTGYIVEAGWCLLLDTRIGDHKLFVVLLDSSGAGSRLGDAERIRHWASAQLGVPAKNEAPRHKKSQKAEKKIETMSEKNT